MSDPTDFLYPMVDRDQAGTEDDLEALLTDLAQSAREKIGISHTVTADAKAEHATALATIATELSERLRQGGRIFTCGNGGSATDADGVASLFRHPPSGRPLPATSLVADMAVVTALANDIGFEVVYARQVMAHAVPADTLLGFSTSGNSANVLEAIGAAHRKGMLTVGFAGDRGGAMAASDDLDHCLVVRATSIHRIQEAQSALAFDLWQRVQDQLVARDLPVSSGSPA